MIELSAGVITGLIALLGAAWRAYKGYQGHRSKRGYEPFSLKKFLISVTPAALLGFLMGYFLIPGNLIIWIMLFFAGIGIGSFSDKIPFTRRKK